MHETVCCTRELKGQRVDGGIEGTITLVKAIFSCKVKGFSEVQPPIMVSLTLASTTVLTVREHRQMVLSLGGESIGVLTVLVCLVTVLVVSVREVSTGANGSVSNLVAG